MSFANAEVTEDSVKNVLYIDETRDLSNGLSGIAELFRSKYHILGSCLKDGVSLSNTTVRAPGRTGVEEGFKKL